MGPILHVHETICYNLYMARGPFCHAGERYIMNQEIKKITDGAMMIAIVGAVLLMDRQLAGTLSSMLLFLFPLPMVFYSAKYGLKASGMVLGALCALVFILGTPQSMFFVISESVIGTIYGASVHAGTENRRILLRTLFLGGIVELLAMVIFASFFGYDVTSEITEYTKIMDQLTAQTGVEFPVSLTNADPLRTLFVISAILTGVMEGMVTHLAARLMLKRLRFPVPKSTPIEQYYPPKWTGYLAFGAMCVYYYSIFRPFDAEVYQTAAMALGTLGLIYLLGFGVLAILIFVPKVFPKIRMWLVLIVVLMVFTMSLPLAITGFLYITTDLHERISKGGVYASEN